jgi:AI-2 transport protein TqsA
MKNNALTNAASIIILLFSIIYTLHLGRPLILPLVVALVLWYIIIRVTKLVQRVEIGSWNPPYSLALTVSIVIAIMILYFFVELVSQSIANIINEAPAYQARLQELLNMASTLIHKKIELVQIIQTINFKTWLSKIAVIISSMTSNFTLILIYLLFLLLEYKTFDKKIRRVCSTDKQYKHASEIISKIDEDINTYLKIKTSVNALAGLLSYILLLSFHVNYAEFWGVMFFLLHYIPFIGPIVGVIVVLLATSIQVTNFYAFGILGFLLIAVQFLVGNFLEPRWMGTRLNLSPIIILISLAFWGALWGIIGMFFCVPLMVIIAIILAKFPNTRPAAVLLTTSGDL